MPGYSGALGFETLDRFRRAVLFSDPMPITPTDALRVLEILDAAHLAAKEQRRIEIHPA